MNRNIVFLLIGVFLLQSSNIFTQKAKDTQAAFAQAINSGNYMTIKTMVMADPTLATKKLMSGTLPLQKIQSLLTDQTKAGGMDAEHNNYRDIKNILEAASGPKQALTKAIVGSDPANVNLAEEALLFVSNKKVKPGTTLDLNALRMALQSARLQQSSNMTLGKGQDANLATIIDKVNAFTVNDSNYKPNPQKMTQPQNIK